MLGNFEQGLSQVAGLVAVVLSPQLFQPCRELINKNVWETLIVHGIKSGELLVVLYPVNLLWVKYKSVFCKFTQDVYSGTKKDRNYWSMQTLVCSGNSHGSYTGAQKTVKVNGAIEISGNKDKDIEKRRKYWTGRQWR